MNNYKDIKTCKKLIKIARAAKLLAKEHLITPSKATTCVSEMALDYNSNIDAAIQDMRMDRCMNNVDDEYSALEDWDDDEYSSAVGCDDDKPVVKPQNLFDTVDADGDDISVICDNTDTVRAINVKDMFKFADGVIDYLIQRIHKDKSHLLAA